MSCLVVPDYWAWACGDGVSVGSGDNDKSVSIECNPRQSDGDYQTIAGLVRDLRAAYVDLSPLPARRWFNTACPGTCDLAGIDRIARGLPTRATPWPAVKPSPTVPAASDDTNAMYGLTVPYITGFTSLEASGYLR